MKIIVNGLGVLGVWLWAPILAVAQPPTADPVRKIEEVGSWIVGCAQPALPGSPDCDIRHHTWLIAPAGRRPPAVLEIQQLHGVAVPVVAIQGVPTPDAAGALLALSTGASVQFDADPPVQLPCGFAQDTIRCAPARIDAPAVSAQLRRAKTAVIRLHLAAPVKLPANLTAGLPTPIPDQLRSLELTRTAEAMDHLRQPGEAADTRWDLHDLLDWLARQLGFPSGLDDLLHWLLGQAATLQKG